MGSSLKGIVVKGTLWLSASKALSQAFSWAITIIVARILSPTDYGLIGMAAILIEFFQYFNEAGLGAAIIQRQSVEEEDLRSIFGFTIVLNLVLYAVVWVSAPAVAYFFKAPQLTLIVRVLAISLILGGMRIIPLNLLKKEMEFEKYSKAELISIIVSSAASLGMALAGVGVWTLVGANLIRNVLWNILLIRYCPWPLRASFQWVRVKSFLTFGINLSGARMLRSFYSQADYIIVGRFVGSHALGIYTMAFEIAARPFYKLAEVTNAVFYPLFSKIQENTEELRRHFLRLSEVVGLLAFPVMIGLFCVANELVDVLLTEKWAPMIFPLKVLCITGLFQALVPTISSLLAARGRPNVVLKYNIACAIVLPTSFLIGCRLNGVNGVAISWLAVFPLIFFWYLLSGLREIESSVGDYIRALKVPIVATVIMSGIVLIAHPLLVHRLDPIWLLASKCCLGGAIYAIAVLSASSWTRQQVQEAGLYIKNMRLNKVGISG